MLAQLIQALYNIVDSYFIGKYSKDGLAALSVIFPIQLLISALAIGTGVGAGTVMSKYYGLSKEKEAKETAGVGFLLSRLYLYIICAYFKQYYGNIYNNFFADTTGTVFCLHIWKNCLRI